VSKAGAGSIEGSTRSDIRFDPAIQTTRKVAQVVQEIRITTRMVQVREMSKCVFQYNLNATTVDMLSIPGIVLDG